MDFVELLYGCKFVIFVIVVFEFCCVIFINKGFKLF